MASRKSGQHHRKRQQLLQQLESRQMLAGPQLIGIQPNEGDLIVDGTILNIAPRALTLRFDEIQQIAASSFDGIQITRSGPDGAFGTADDVRIVPGLVTLGDIRQNEVIVRFNENLPDDQYQLRINALDDTVNNVVALRNLNGEAFVPQVAGARSQTTNFTLNLGALVEAIVPQPVVRNANGTLTQRRDEIVVYFNEDTLFVENDPGSGLPTLRSAENPRFYQLLLTQETVRTTDDAIFHPQRVIYDAPTNTARLIFATDIDKLQGVSQFGGTFRLRVGSAVDTNADLVFAPTRLSVADAGDTISTAFNVGSFTTSSSFIISGAIEPQSFGIQLPGSTSDPGRLQIPEGVGGGLAQVINERFGPDSTDGITEIAYNFQTVFAGGVFGQPSQLNSITAVQKQRIREALSLWSRYLGVQFRETARSGITFAVGNVNSLTNVTGLQSQTFPQLNARLRIDPNFNIDPANGPVNSSAIVFSSATSFGTAYGQDFFRKAMAGIGFLLGLEQSSDQNSQSLLTLDTIFLNETIDPAAFLAPLDSFLPVQTSRQQTINDAIDAQTIDNPVPNALEGSEPTFPGNIDILQGQFLHRPDGNDVDLYRFTVNLGAESATGTLNVESFAERLASSSLLDTSLRLFREQAASAVTDLGLGSALSVKISSVQAGSAGNNASISFVQSNRAAGDTAVRVSRATGSNGLLVSNAIIVDIPRLTSNVTSVPVSAVVNAINADAFARTLFLASLEVGAPTSNIARSSGTFLPVTLSGGGIVSLARNDDYFSEDSLLTAELGNGVYYIGIASTGNDTYDPALVNSGFGGTTQGKYDLQIRFLPKVSDFDSIRDRDTVRVGVPGTALDGDGDGTPGGVKNFWFQTRPLERLIEFTGNGAAVVIGQTFTIVGANGEERIFEYINASTGGTPQPGNIPVPITPTAQFSAGLVAAAVRAAIQSVRLETFVTADQVGNVLTLHGERSIKFSGNFRGVEVHGRTIFVDKTASVIADGTAARPFNTINNPITPSAFGVTFPSDIVRIVGNGGQDGRLETQADNFAYQVGIPETGGNTLPDGLNLEVPKGVTVMIDAGAAFKLRSSVISVGSSNLLVDRSGGALQVLGTPRLVTLTDPTATSHGVSLVLNAQGLSASGNVTFTSTRDRSVDSAASGNSQAAAPGNWGGLIFRRDVDSAQGRADLEDQGVFLQTVNHADIRFGGGSNLFIDAVQQAVTAIQLVDLRPTLTFNRLTFNSGAAIGASPDTFEETSFQAPVFQQAGQFTPDYGRVGPDINNNVLTNNSINALFVRTITVPGTVPRQLTVAGRFDDVDIVHYIAESLVVAGTPGGSIQDGVQPDFSNVATTARPGGVLTAGAYTYRLTFVDGNGFESLASVPTAARTVTTGQAIELVNLPSIAPSSDYVSRRLYRSRPGQNVFDLAVELPASGGVYTDNGAFRGAPLDLAATGIRGRLDASLVVDPGIVVKLRGARIELGQGTQLLAEGTASRPVIFTSAVDDRFGGGGSFDTNNDRSLPGGGATPQRGDWSGIYAAPNSNVSFDFTTVAYGGGVSLIEGGQTRGFLPLELQQASARIANSRFEFNDSGQDGSGPVGRNGRLAITPAVIFVRGSQPVLVDNQFVDNFGSIIDIDLGSMSDQLIQDLGRQRGALDRFDEFDDNQGPLIRLNTTSSPAGDVEGERQLNGLRIRGGRLATGSVWDDTDIAHVLFDSVTVGNQASGGALTLKSRPDESLVIKLLGGGTPNSPTLGTGFTATGSTSDIADRIGGTIHILGLSSAPVVFTSYHDDGVGAGKRLDGVAQTDTNGDGFGSRPAANDWRSLYLDGLSNDRNVAALQEFERSTELAPGLNGTTVNAQVLGDLAERLTASDDQLRLGFDVRGYLSEINDVDTYAFTGVSGTQVWLDVDYTSFSLDTVVELLDPNGVVLARSDNSFDEFGNPTRIFSTLPTAFGSLADDGPFADKWESGLYADYGSTNPRDAGFRFALPGDPGIRNGYFIRVRSASSDPADVRGGTTRGAYSFQIRLREEQEFPGSVVKFADIRFANNGIHLQSLPGSSPLLGESQENESADVGSSFSTTAVAGGSGFDTVRYATNVYANNDLLNGGIAFPTGILGVQTRPLGARAQYIGNLVDSKTGTISVGGELSATSDIDFYQIDVRYNSTLGGLQRSTVFDIDYADGLDRPDTNLSIYYSATGSPNDARLVLFGSNSNIVEDQSSPLSDADIGELLSRGSVATGDAFVGPISLAQGSYFVAVTERGRTPQEFLVNPSARREPLDSITRIFEDHVESIGGGTAAAPIEGSFVASTSTGWSVTANRATNPGHQITGTFNGSRVATSFPPSNQFESELNDSFATANSLEGIPYSLAFEANIGNTTVNTSLSIPHTTVSATTSGDVVDIYQFVVPTNGSSVVLDIDNGFNPQSLSDFTSVDLKLQLFQEFVDPVTGATSRLLIQTNNFAPTASGAQGSQGGLIAGVGGLTQFSADPYIETLLNAGTYYVAVSPELTIYDATTETFTLDVAMLPVFGTYQLNVSIENHSFAGGDPNNQSYFFDRSAATGTLQSAAFDLNGYSAAELPRFYFDYYYDPSSGDSVTLTATSAQRTTPVGLTLNLQPFAAGQTWRQSVVDLSSFAGNTDIVLEFTYNSVPLDLSGEGLYLDNFVVGFAERGELVTGSIAGNGAFTTSFSGTPGQYQLEIRPGSDYTTQVQGGIQLARSFDTNDRQAQQITLIAPAGADLVNGDRFVLGDGNRTLTFEFRSSGAAAAGNFSVPFSAADSAATVARRIIEAINSGTVQNILTLKAATSSGQSNFTQTVNLPTDARIALQGTARGNFIPVTAVPVAGTPVVRGSDGALALAAIYYDGVGDVNTVRTQGEVIVDSNRVSDVRAVGIYSDVGFRGTDPEDDRSPEVFLNGKNHLRLPPVGNSQLGAVLNLPRANDSVVGGIVPGVTIQNNIVDQAGFTGIKVDGETRPFVIEWNGNSTTYASGGTVLGSRADILVPDGFIFAIDAGGTRVVFEFDDISGSPTAVGGSGQVGGDGFVDGHVPVYYRLGGGATYNPSAPTPIRDFGYTAHELMYAIYEAIQGSILVTNGLIELVRPTIGPSLTTPVGPNFRTLGTTPVVPSLFSNPSTLDFANPAVYLEGVSGIYTSVVFQKAGQLAQLSIFGSLGEIGTTFDSTTGATDNPTPPLAPVYEPPQPLARILNNTVYGADGTESSYLSDGSISRAIEFPSGDVNDTVAGALDTKQGRSQRGAYITQSVLGDNVSVLATTQDVDFYQVQLSVGDRLAVDIDTLAAGPTAAIRLFDARGIEVAIGVQGEVPLSIKPGSSVEFPSAAVNNQRDRFIDYTVLESGTYYIGVSSVGNETYDALSLTDRTDSTGGTGGYQIGIEVFSPRSFVLSLDSHPLTPFGAEVTSGTINGTTSFGGPNGAPTLIGTTFTISQIPDYLVPTRTGDAYQAVRPDGNRVTFEFTDTVNRIVLANGNINVPLLRGASATDLQTHKVQDIMRAIANAINGYLNNPALPNHELGNGPEGSSGPVRRVQARAIGGSQNDNLGIVNLSREEGAPFAPTPGGGFDFTSGFGHDRRESGGTANIVPDGTFTDSRGSTELYVLIERAAKIELSPEARAAGLKLGPDNSTDANGDPTRAQFATGSDQVLTEFGILISSGASAAILNNVVINAHQSIVKDETSVFGFGGRIDAQNPDRTVKPAQVVLTGNTFEFDDERNTQIRSDLSWWVTGGINVINRNPVLDSSLSTDLRTGPSNVRGGNSDFNFVVRPAGTPGQSPGNFISLVGSSLVDNPAANLFTPILNSPIVNSAVDAILENTALATLKSEVGIPSGQIIAPLRDNTGQLRADGNGTGPTGGVGANVFKDRGAVERADFVGPVAILEFPRDNDAFGVDSDPTVSFLQLTSGVYNEFRVQLQDAGDASDPFAGSGIDDDTVVVPVIAGLRASGANVALFEGDRLLVEGIDYTFSYDRTKNVISLRPLAGIWREDRAYRIKLNNRDRIVAVAPAAGQVLDGDSFAVIDSQGGRVTFEYDSGFQLRVPETLQLTVPAAGVGGVADGDIFSLTGTDGSSVLFQFRVTDAALPGTRLIRFQPTQSPTEIAASIRTAIAAAKAQGVFDVDVDVNATGPTVVIGSDAGTVLDLSRSNLLNAPRTLALRVPAAGAGPAGVNDGDVLTISDGSTVVSFEFEITGGLNNTANTVISIAGLSQADGVLLAIQNAISNSALKLSPIGIGNNLFLGLPSDGFATVSTGQLTPIGISRTPANADTITFTPVAGLPTTLTLTRGAATLPTDIAFTRLSTADQLASSIATVIQNQVITGLEDRAAIQANPGGLVSIGGSAGLQLTLNPTSTLLVTGQPDVAGSTLLTITGPLLAQLPTLGGNGIPDDSQFTLSDGTNTITFIYNLVLTGISNLTATQIPYRTSETVDQIAANTVAAINTAFAGSIVATDQGAGLISFGLITDSQLTFPPAPAITAPFTVRRGVVTDGEQVVITQNGQTRVFEFDAASGGGGVANGAIPVVFQATGSIADVATALAAAINNNRGSLSLTATVEGGINVRLADTPQTTTVVRTQNPLGTISITVSGEAGGAIAIPFTGSFTAEDVKRSSIDAINRASAAGITTLTAEDRGGSTYFIENGVFIEGPLANFNLQGIKDVAGQLLEPTRGDNTTQFTILLPGIGLDYGDAPDPVGIVRGRYPTLLDANGPRHVVNGQVLLGRLIDIDSNGLPSAAANGDDTTIFVVGTTTGIFVPTINAIEGFVEVAFNLPGTPSTADGNTITLSTGSATVTYEFDTDGIFNEDNFPVSVDTSQPVTQAIVAAAFRDAILKNGVPQSPLRPADVQVVNNRVRVIADDEDGVTFGDSSNPNGVFNRGIPTPISVTVTGGGVVEAWVDFNFDGDFTDPGEQIINRDTVGAVFSANATNSPVTRTFIINVPATAPVPTASTFTYARFRVSAEGGLAPTGLALSGEVEDYRVTILPGLPPDVNATNRAVSYTVNEDLILQANDADGTLTPASANDNGALAAIRDPDGDLVAVLASDVGTRTLVDPNGITAGSVTLFDDGTFLFQPAADFFGNTQFMFHVVDVPLTDPLRQIVSPIQLTVNITVNPVNDRPFVSGNAPTITRTINEDAVQTFTTAELTAFYSPGPANESGQPLIILSAGTNGSGFQTDRGGSLTLVGGNLVYTPPANLFGVDGFRYVVADDPNDLNQLVQTAAIRGTVVININSVNDVPFAGTDTYSTDEDISLVIPINGSGGILANDNAGPQDERDAGQTVSLILSDFPKLTDRGGRIELGATGTLIYSPALDFTGQDQFTYRISDSGVPSAIGTGTVRINVGGQNDPPTFIGVNGIPSQRSIELNESKETELVYNFNLSSWFSDPEGDLSTFTVTSSDPTIVRSEVILDNATGVSTLRLSLPSFRNGSVLLDIVATNVGVGGPSGTAQVPVNVLNTPDPPNIIGTLDPLSATEDEVITRNLTTVFSDPDGGVLNYTVTRLGSLVNPNAAQIASSPLVNAITFNGNTLTIALDPDASGSVDIEISASDGTFIVTDNFTLTVTASPDAPRGNAIDLDGDGIGENDFYNVPIGARFEIIDPSQGLLRNDIDPDDDVFPGTTTKVRVDVSSVTQPSRGTVTVNADGTFVYINAGGAIGDTDSFTYRPIDPTGLIGNVATVTFNLGRSRYQNPIPGFNTDVTANGVVSPLDALRVINLLTRFRSVSVPVSSLTTAPPDFFDVNGDGFVTPNDALLVINDIVRRSRRRGGPEGEMAAELATTIAYAAPTTFGLAESNRVAPLADPLPADPGPTTNDPFAGIEFIDAVVAKSAEELMQLNQTSGSSENTVSAVDEVLSSWFEPTNL